METTTRPLTAKERTDLARLTSPHGQLSAELLGGFTAFALLFMVGVWSVRFIAGPPQGATLAWIAAVTGSIALVVMLRVRRSVAPTFAHHRSLHAEDLAAGHAVCTTFEITDALRVEEFEDEGSQYYLALTDGRVLFVSGQWLYEYEDGEDEDGKPTPARFPCRRFTLERAAKSGLFLDLIPQGPAFPPSDTLPPFKDADHTAGTVPDDGDVLTVDFDSLRKRRAG
ncbi:MAG: hypothetical protein ABL998_15660 [Planctomycetota bacterium]